VVVGTVKVVENSTDYSLQNTIQQALFLPTSRDAKYKAKSAIDTLSVRLGDLVSTGLVVVGTALHFTTMAFAITNVVAGLGWIWLATNLRQRQVAMTAAAAAADATAAAVPVTTAPA